MARANRLVVGLIVAMAIAAPDGASAQTTDLSGSWDWTDVTSEGAVYTGTATIAHDVAAGTFSWSWIYGYEGQGTLSGTSLTLHGTAQGFFVGDFTGTLQSDGSLSGTWTQNDGSHGTFTATRTDDPDVDRDGVLNVNDNCVDTFNPDQLDSDADGMGDECELCPSRGTIAGEWHGGPLDTTGLGDPYVGYGLEVRWCQAPGVNKPEITSATVDLTKDLGTTKTFERVRRALLVVGVGWQYVWKPGKSQQPKIRTLGDGTQQVTASTGHFDQCATPLSDLFTAPIAGFGISGPAFKLLPKKVQQKLAKQFKRVVQRLWKKSYGKSLRTSIEHQLRVTQGLTKAQARKESKRRAASLIFQLSFGFEQIVDDMLVRIVKGVTGGRFCVEVWKPKIVARIPPSGAATIDEVGKLGRGWNTVRIR